MRHIRYVKGKQVPWEKVLMVTSHNDKVMEHTDAIIEPRLECGHANETVGWEWYEETLGIEFLPEELK